MKVTSRSHSYLSKTNMKQASTDSRTGRPTTLEANTLLGSPKSPEAVLNLMVGRRQYTLLDIWKRERPCAGTSLRAASISDFYCAQDTKNLAISLTV